MRPTFHNQGIAVTGRGVFNHVVMIIACPACATRYAVPDSAIGVEGRTVRCAKCRHSWFQDGPALAAPPPPAPAQPASPPVAEPEPAPQPAAAVPPAAEPEASAPPASAEPAATPEPEAEAEAGPDQAPASSEPVPPEPSPSDTLPTGFSHPPVDEPAVGEPGSASPEPEPLPPPPVGYADMPPAEAEAEPAYDSEFDEAPSSFAHEPPFGARRNPARMWTIAAALFATVSLGVVGATAWWGLPDWMPFAHPLFAEAQPGLKLDFPAKQQDRHQLPDNTWYFGASGTVTNLSKTARSVPPILIVLRDARGRVVYNAEVQAPKRVLAPGESVSINEALVQVPKAAVKAEFGWKPG